MSQVSMGGHRVKQNFEFMFINTKEDVLNVNVTGINYVDGNHSEHNFQPNPNYQGFMGLSPMTDENDGQSNNFLKQLKDSEVIDHMTFSLYLRNTSGDHSSIKFGGYDKTAMPEGTELKLLKTRSPESWELRFRDNPMISANSIFIWPQYTYAIFDPGASFIHVPLSHFRKLYPYIIKTVGYDYENNEYFIKCDDL